MKTVILIFLIALAAYVFFIVLPAFVSFYFVFRRKKGRPVSREILKASYYEPYAEEMLESMEFIGGLERKEIRNRAADGTELVADYVTQGSDSLVIMFHGYNVQPLLNYAFPGRLLYGAGYDLLLTDQRGHGRSGGRYTMMGAGEKTDVADWIRWAKENTGAKKIFIYGISMGATTVAMASDMPELSGVSAIICDGGYSSVYDVMHCDMKKRHLPAKLMLPYLCFAAGLVLKIDMKESTCTHLQASGIPAVFLHGRGDKTVPYEQGRRGYEKCGSKKIFIDSENANHTCTLMENEKAGHRLLEFLKEL